jgi:hypothetical protein
MTEEKQNPKGEMSNGAKYALIGTIFTAVVGLIGTALTLYFDYLKTIEPQKLALQATQTAEARWVALSATVIPATTFTATSLLPTETATFTLTPTVTATSIPATFTFTPTASAQGTKYCVDTASLNVRAGPGIDYAIVGRLTQDTCIYFDGRLENLENKWVRISAGQPGYEAIGNMWVYGGFLRPQDFERLPIVPPPAPPPPPTPTPAG